MESLQSSQNPVVRALTLLVAAVAVGVSLVFGFIAFLVLAGMALILVAVVAVRVWWLRHKLRQRATEHRKHASGDFIEGDFEVERRSEDASHER